LLRSVAQCLPTKDSPNHLGTNRTRRFVRINRPLELIQPCRSRFAGIEHQTTSSGLRTGFPRLPTVECGFDTDAPNACDRPA
jgi:hypothetical protein